jgi:hypothetical protein
MIAEPTSIILECYYGYSNEEITYVSKQDILLVPDLKNEINEKDDSETTMDNILTKTFGKKKIEKLEKIQSEQEDSEEISKELLKLSKEYGIVTNTSSYIILESIDKYLEHQIEPPDSLPKLKEQYLLHLSKSIERKQIESKDKIKSTMIVWEKKVLR